MMCSCTRTPGRGSSWGARCRNNAGVRKRGGEISGRDWSIRRGHQRGFGNAGRCRPARSPGLLPGAPLFALGALPLDARVMLIALFGQIGSTLGLQID